MKSDKWIVIRPHVSEFPEPMVVKKGDRVSVSELYEGPEGWPDWYLYSSPGQQAGFMAEQILDRHADESATMLGDFTNRELHVVEGEMLHGERQLNGWLWATRISDSATGWVPLDNIRTGDPESQSRKS